MQQLEVEPSWVIENTEVDSNIPQIEEAPHGYIRLFCSHCGLFRDIPLRCKDRTCHSCAIKRQRMLVGRTYNIVKKMEISSSCKWSHLILTQKSTFDLQHGCRELVDKFRRLRQKPIWKKAVIGGFFSIEAKDNPQGWHIHIHALILHKWITQESIKKAWSEVQHYDSIIWINFLPLNANLKAVIMEVIKYASKGNTVKEEHKWTFNKVMRCRKLFSYFGCIGKLYKETKVSKPIFECPKCHGTVWFTQQQLNRQRNKESIRIINSS
jgi:hypothetical protein